MDFQKQMKQAPELVKLRERISTIEADIQSLEQSKPALIQAIESAQDKKRSVAVAIELGKAKPDAITDLDQKFEQAKRDLDNAHESLKVKQLALEQLRDDMTHAEKKIRERLKKAFDKDHDKLIDRQAKAFKEFLNISEELKELEANASRAEIPTGSFGFDIGELRRRHQPRLPFWIDRAHASGKLDI